VICPRISPAGFFAVCTLAYVLRAFRSAIWAAVTVVLPVTGDVQGTTVHSGTSTAPLTPLAPRWMCAAVAGSERWVKVSRQCRVVPVSVAVNRPEAPTFVPFGCGRS
jgi:hypothetical protein